MRRDAYVAVIGCFSFLVLLNGTVLVGVLCLIVRGVCVCGDACRVGRSVVAWGKRRKDI
jgi:hypothetical protein